MSLPRNPRRRSPALHAASVLSTLIKGATFHSSSSSPSCETFATVPPSPTDHFIPPRLVHAQTSLDDVIDSHCRRAALIVDGFDKSLSGAAGKLASLTSLVGGGAGGEILPIPRALLGFRTAAEPEMKTADAETEAAPDAAAAPAGFSGRILARPRTPGQASRHSHASDSAIGSSIRSSKERKRPSDSPRAAAPPKTSAITRSAAGAAPVALVSSPGLGSRAMNRIHEHILRPLLDKPSLKEFELLFLDLPRRMREKEIVCLRDLEKTLISVAQAKTKTAALYLDLCLTSIRCIQATFEYLPDREQTRIQDRPYTHGYFIDLKGQIFQYAKQLAGVKEAGPAQANDLDLDITDEVRLYGGVAKNGQPAELIRLKQDGSAFSLATGKPVHLEMEHPPAVPRMKRALSEQADDDEDILRSMARRKKNAPVEETAPKPCREPGCHKTFKRACDLTKHEKTHLRPWKCRIETCKYHERGWPTEKELDRHWNDKHSADPPMFCCNFVPCPYKSKRESNCKQHMEKAHGWTYVRQKTNGNKKSNPPSACGGGPQSVSPISDPYSMPTPPSEDRIYAPFHAFVCPAYPSDQEYQQVHGPIRDSLDEVDLGLSEVSGQASQPFEAYGNAFQDSPDFMVPDEELYAAAAHLPTPSPMSYVAKMEPIQVPVFDLAAEMSVAAAAAAGQVPHHHHQNGPAPFSPGAEGDAMLYTPTSMENDDGLEDAYKGGSFQLFPAVVKAMQPSDLLFNPMPSSMLSFSQQPTQEMFPAPPEPGQMDWSASPQQQHHQLQHQLQHQHQHQQHHHAFHSYN